MNPVKLADGRLCVLRAVTDADIPQVIENIDSVAAERVYIASEGVADPERFERQLWEQVRAGKWRYMVAEVDGMVVGAVNLQIGSPSKRRHTAYVGALVVREFMGLGIGTAMMAHAATMAKDLGVEKLQLSAFSTNARAIGFYKKCGFEVEAVLKRQFLIDGAYVDEVCMARWL